MIEVKSYYPREEAEFGPIAPEYRGPVELSLYGGWTMYSGDLDVESGGSLLGGVRFTVNFGEEDQVGLDFTWGVTRINFHIDETDSVAGRGFGRKDIRGEVTINSFVVGLTYRMTYLRFEYLTPFVRAGVGVNYFEDEVGRGTFQPNNNGALQQFTERLDSEFGIMGRLGFGFDYKIDKNWSIRTEYSLDVMINSWADRDDPQFAGNAQLGFVWHFQ